PDPGNAPTSSNPTSAHSDRCRGNTLRRAPSHQGLRQEAAKVESEEDFDDTSESAGEEVLTEELNGFLARRLPNPDELARIHAFLREALSWPDTTVRLGTSKKTEDGKSNWAAISRGGWGGRFLVLFPKAMRVRFRLQEDDVSDLPDAEFRKVRPGAPWRVRGRLMVSNGVDTCLTMARRAYEKVGQHRDGGAKSNPELGA
ncbi:MAG: hypothetical protein ACRDXD_07710, partial [Acidimicrobiia bacterium]